MATLAMPITYTLQEDSYRQEKALVLDAIQYTLFNSVASISKSTGLNEETLEILLDKMERDGYVVSDERDGNRTYSPAPEHEPRHDFESFLINNTQNILKPHEPVSVLRMYVYPSTYVKVKPHIGGVSGTVRHLLDTGSLPGDFEAFVRDEEPREVKVSLPSTYKEAFKLFFGSAETHQEVAALFDAALAYEKAKRFEQEIGKAHS